MHAESANTTSRLLAHNLKGTKMKLRNVVVLMVGGLLVGTGAATSQTEGCRTDMSVIECVRRVAEIARGFDDQVKAVYSEITRKELPVGTVITSILPPEEFLNDKNPQFDNSRWVPADGRALPANSIYQKLTSKAYAPDLRKTSQQKIVLDVVEGVAEAGQVVDQLKTPQFADSDWRFHFAPRTVQGSRANNDVEQDTDQFEVLVDGGKIVAHGRTLNWKHNVWGPWSNGNTNYVGIATVASPFFYYVKVN